MVKLERYVTPDNKRSLGFSKLFPHHLVLSNRFKVTVTLEVVSKNIAMDPNFIPTDIGGESEKIFYTLDYVNRPPLFYEKSSDSHPKKGLCDQTQRECDPKNGLCLSSNNDNTLANIGLNSECNPKNQLCIASNNDQTGAHIDVYTPVSVHVSKLMEQNAKKPAFQRSKLMIDRERVRQNILTTGTDEKCPNNKQLRLSQCTNFVPFARIRRRPYDFITEPVHNEFIMKEGKALQIIVQITTDLNIPPEEGHRFVPIIDCFPSSKGKRMSLCKKSIDGVWGFWSRLLSDRKNWKEMAWLHFPTLNALRISFQYDFLYNRGIKAICCISLWRKPDEHWWKIERYSFIRPLIAKSKTYAVIKAVYASKNGNVMDYVAFYVDYS